MVRSVIQCGYNLVTCLIRHLMSRVTVTFFYDVIVWEVGHSDTKITKVHAKTQPPVLQTATKKLEMQMPIAEQKFLK